jgi:asparagine synthase (glutamine-hydrolysing)
MCGIVGAIRRSGGLHEQFVRSMATNIAYRGPDSSGEWVSEGAQVAFGHRRLSILDLSPLGHQPMVSSSGRYTITFNGEIFNFKEIARTLTTPLKGGSDTEVILACCERDGAKQAVQHFVGMFAYAIWDKVERSVTLVRDRLGIKPLYYGWWKDTFLFTSDLRALKGIDGFSLEPSKEATALYLQYGYVPAPWSIFPTFWKLPPGHSLTVRVDTLQEGAQGEPAPFWSYPSYDPDQCDSDFDSGRREGAQGESSEFSLDALEQRLLEAVNLRLVADVPVGAFLSGGVDSSLVVALMQRCVASTGSTSPVKTFSIGFGEQGFNEAPFAKSAATHLGTDHTELIVTDRMALDVLPMIAGMCDEPFADSSIIPTYLVCKLARQHVTVSLSGDGGDELFNGYNRYAILSKLMYLRSLLPESVLRPLLFLGRVIPLGLIDILQKVLRRAGIFYFSLSTPGEKLRRTLDVLSEKRNVELYYRAIRHWRDVREVLHGGSSPIEVSMVDECLDPRRTMSRADIQMYLPDDILTKVDRASMAVSLEARVPLLDHRVVEYASRIPMDVLYRDGRGKWPLRALVQRYLPRHIMERPKSGFSIPLDAWLRTELREWAEPLLAAPCLEESGLIPGPIRKVWREHLAGRRNHSQLLWVVLMYQEWRFAQSP